MKKSLLIIVLIITSSFLLFPQDGGEVPADDLYTRTIVADIETSDFFELTSWCERLKLPVDGAAAELRKRLYNFYGVSAEKTASGSENGKQSITIEKADNLEYFTIENVDENYVKISGGVNVRLYDDEKKESHTIKADTVLFNFKENYLTATGNIRYTLDGETKTENFRGEKITFNLDNNTGLFDQGLTEQTKTIDDEDLVFYFKGDLINKTAENFVVLENGEITSCDFDDPHFKIKASKIWLLASNEWAIMNGIVYIGRIPILYLPGFIYPGDDIFINPTFGLRTDFGYFLQTTTYLIGKKEEDEDSAFSFMQSENEKKYLKREGLFLTEDEAPSEFSTYIQDYGASENYIKLIFDYYTNLGFYSAIDLDLDKPSSGDSGNSALDLILSLVLVVENTELYISVARTRKIEQTGSSYSVLFPDDDNIYSSIWYDSYLLGHSLPFRYGFEYATSLNMDWLKINIDLAAYSDRAYTEDFADRSENMNLLSMLSLDTTSTEDSGSETTSYSWEADLTFKPDMKIINPWISSLVINANLNLFWQSKEITDTDSIYDSTVDYFFYPESYIMPSIKGASMTGQLLPFPDKNRAEQPADDGGASELELRPPWVKEPPLTGNDEVPDGLPEAAGDLDIEISDYWSDNDIFSNKLTYYIKPSYTDKTQLDSSEWTAPVDINTMDVEYSYKTEALDAGLDYNAYLFGKLLTLSNSVDFSYDYYEHYNMDSLSSDTIEIYVQEDKQKKALEVKNSLVLSTAPLVYLEYLENTKLKYTLSSYIYKNEYSKDTDEYMDLFFKNNQDFITAHSLTYSMPFDFPKINHTFEVTTTLPPIDLKTTGSYELKYGISTTEINTSILQDDDEYTFEPLNINQKLNFFDGTWLSNSLSYDYSEYALESNLFSGKLTLLDGHFTTDTTFEYDFIENEIDTLNVNFGLYGTYLKIYSGENYDYNFDPEIGWVRADETSFLMSKISVGADYNTDFLKFWKNRIDFELSVNSNLDLDLIKYNNSVYNFELKLNFGIFEFMDFYIASVSENTSVFRYFPSFCSDLGVPSLDLGSDLLKSFNFFNVDDRYESNFNLSSINIGLTHDLHDWDLSIDYTGSPYINYDGDVPVYDWESTLKIYLKWKAIPDIKSEIEIDNEDVSF